MKYTRRFSRAAGALLLAGAALALPPFDAPAALAAAKSPAGIKVDQQLAKLRRQTNTEIRAQERKASTARQDRLREQMRPGSPQNRIDRQNDQQRDRTEELRDRLADQKETAEEQQAGK